MNGWFRSFRLAVLASLLFLPCRATLGQEPPSAQPVAGNPVILEHGTPVYVADPAEYPSMPERRRLFPRLQDQLHAHGLGCYATFETLGCSTLHSDLTFIFGSCRTFFGDTCAPRPDGAPGYGCATGGCR